MSEKSLSVPLFVSCALSQSDSTNSFNSLQPSSGKAEHRPYTLKFHCIMFLCVITWAWVPPGNCSLINLRCLRTPAGFCCSPRAAQWALWWVLQCCSQPAPSASLQLWNFVLWGESPGENPDVPCRQWHFCHQLQWTQNSLIQDAALCSCAAMRGKPKLSALHTLHADSHLSPQGRGRPVLTNIPTQYETWILSPPVGLTQCFNSEYPN